MRKFILFFALLLFALPQIAGAQKLENSPLLNKPMPAIEGLTLNGKKIDKAYFKGKVTLVNFMFIGCMPCMKEIPVLNSLHLNNSANPGFQVLGVSANTAEQLTHFQTEKDTTIYSRIRRVLQSEIINYDLMAACEKQKPYPANSLGAECKTLSGKFKFNGYPTSFLIDKNGKVRYVFNGFPMSDAAREVDENGKFTFPAEAISANNNQVVAELQAQVDKLLND